MPNYTWECKCGFQVEVSCPIEDRDVPPFYYKPNHAKDCNKPEWRRLLQAPAFQLQGGGWYKDGY